MVEGRWTTPLAELGVDVGGGEGGTSPPEEAEGVQGEEGSANRLILRVKSGSELTWTR